MKLFLRIDFVSAQLWSTLRMRMVAALVKFALKLYLREHIGIDTNTR